MASEANDLEQVEVEARRAGVSESPLNLTFENAYELFKGGVWGTKEFRKWLARKDGDFREVRDQDVDNEIERIAQERRRQLEEQLADGSFQYDGQREQQDQSGQV